MFSTSCLPASYNTSLINMSQFSNHPNASCLWFMELYDTLDALALVNSNCLQHEAIAIQYKSATMILSYLSRPRHGAWNEMLNTMASPIHRSWNRTWKSLLIGPNLNRLLHSKGPARNNDTITYCLWERFCIIGRKILRTSMYDCGNSTWIHEKIPIGTEDSRRLLQVSAKEITCEPTTSYGATNHEIRLPVHLPSYLGIPSYCRCC